MAARVRGVATGCGTALGMSDARGVIGGGSPSGLKTFVVLPQLVYLRGYAGVVSSSFFSSFRKPSSAVLTSSGCVQDMQWGPSFTTTRRAPGTIFAVRCPEAGKGTIR